MTTQFHVSSNGRFINAISASCPLSVGGQLSVAHFEKQGNKNEHLGGVK